MGCAPAKDKNMTEANCADVEYSVGLHLIKFIDLQATLRTSEFKKYYEELQLHKAPQPNLVYPDQIYKPYISEEEFDSLKEMLHETKNYNNWYKFYDLLKDTNGYSSIKLLIASIIFNKTLLVNDK